MLSAGEVVMDQRRDGLPAGGATHEYSCIERQGPVGLLGRVQAPRRAPGAPGVRVTWKFDMVLCLARGGVRPGDVIARIFDALLCAGR
jgi:hypothetical protein